MVSGAPPFTNAEPEDQYYKCIVKNKADLFWQAHSHTKPGGESFYSPEFKDLITGMLQFDPSHRPSMSEILAHPWMRKPIPSSAEI